MILLIIYVFGALFFSFLCSIAEAVLLSITPAYVEKLSITNPTQAKKIKKLRYEQIDRSLAAILTLNTIAHTVGAIVAGAKATRVFGDAWIGLFSAVITVLILLFSEIIPKTIGAVYWKSLAGMNASFISVLIKLLFPLIWISEQVTRLISRGKKQHVFNREEFRAMAGLGKRTGQIQEHELRIIDNLLTLNALTAKDVMTPRNVIVSFAANAHVEDIFEVIQDIHFSRIPIYNDDIDDITSFVLKTDILMAKATGKNGILDDYKRELLCVIGSVTLPQLLEDLLNTRQHMAIVVDEYGNTSGLITLEDVVETLLGLEIMDEVDKVQNMREHARKKWRKRAKEKGLLFEDEANTKTTD